MERSACGLSGACHAAGHAGDPRQTHQAQLATLAAQVGEAQRQLTQRKLAWMATEITKSQLLNLHCGRLKEAGKLTPQQVSMAKMNGCRVARESTHLAREILGANGVADEYQTGRHFCNIEAVYTYEGTDDIHTLIVGQQITGIPAFE